MARRRRRRRATTCRSPRCRRRSARARRDVGEEARSSEVEGETDRGADDRSLEARARAEGVSWCGVPPAYFLKTISTGSSRDQSRDGHRDGTREKREPPTHPSLGSRHHPGLRRDAREDDRREELSPRLRRCLRAVSNDGEPAVEYCSHAVADILERDFVDHGTPLVPRLDRASVHRTSEVDEVATRFGVILLHGPPHHPRYYGQLERQNREHRAWLEAVGRMSPEELLAQCAAMQAAFNARWRRGTLGFRTASELWNERTAIVEDRDALRLEVNERRARLLRNEVAKDLAERLAIEQTLVEHNYLRIENRGRR